MCVSTCMLWLREDQMGAFGQGLTVQPEVVHAG